MGSDSNDPEAQKLEKLNWLLAELKGGQCFRSANREESTVIYHVNGYFVYKHYDHYRPGGDQLDGERTYSPEEVRGLLLSYVRIENGAAVIDGQLVSFYEAIRPELI